MSTLATPAFQPAASIFVTAKTAKDRAMRNCIRKMVTRFIDWVFLSLSLFVWERRGTSVP